MQRLEVSGAVRPIYGSLGVKRLIIYGRDYYGRSQYKGLSLTSLLQLVQQTAVSRDSFRLTSLLQLVQQAAVPRNSLNLTSLIHPRRYPNRVINIQQLCTESNIHENGDRWNLPSERFSGK